MSSSDDISVGERLRLVRENHDCSQQDFADALGVSLRAYQNYERGERPISKELLCALSEKYGENIHWLLMGEKAETKESKAVLLPNFGSLVRLSFQKQGSADVLLGFPEAIRFLDALIEIEDRRDTPNQDRIAQLQHLIDDYHKDEELRIEILARVVIAQNSVKLTPEIKVTAQEVDEWLDDDMPSFEEASHKQISQKVKGNDNQVAGRDVVNKGPRRKKGK